MSVIRTYKPWLRDLAARHARSFVNSPSSQRSKECRVHAAPAVSCARCTKKKRTRAYRFSGNTPAFPAQWLDGLCCALPGERIRLVTVAAGLAADRSGRTDFTTGSLAPATGVGTTQFCRTPWRRSSCAPRTTHEFDLALRLPCAPAPLRPPHPLPRFVTTRDPPLLPGKDGASW